VLPHEELVLSSLWTDNSFLKAVGVRLCELEGYLIQLLVLQTRKAKSREVKIFSKVFYTKLDQC
jgi:hypothetical protein